VKLPLEWLLDLVDVPRDVEVVARTLGLRGFEVAAIERSPHAVIDFEITANRPDCLSIVGLAREASAAFDVPLRLPPTEAARAGATAAAEAPPVDVVLEDADACPRYCAQAFEVRAGAQTPSWMVERLEAAGVRSISAIVDVTNYVMLEMGQPTHAFDLEKLDTRTLRIRAVRAGERIRTLDDVDRPLEPGMLVIADGSRPQAVAGVMGGADSEIGGRTKWMVLESAYFQPASVRRTSKRLGLKTEASARFERGADIDAAPRAIARAALLFEQLGAAHPAGALIDRYPAPRKPLTLTLRADRIERVLGMRVADSKVPGILVPLGFQVNPNQNPNPNENPNENSNENENENLEHRNGTAAPPNRRPPEPRGTRWDVCVPSFRVDVEREIDLIEEVARHDGYASLPATFPELQAAQAAPDARTLLDRRLRHVLTACGMSEAMTFAFIERAAAQPFLGDSQPSELANPLSEKYAVLRPSLLPGLIDSAAHNRRRERKDIRLFETGTRFPAAGEQRAVAGVWTGAGTPPHWGEKPRAVDFFDLKGVVDAMLSALGIEARFDPLQRPYFVEGRSATFTSASGTVLGELGQLEHEVLSARGLPPGEPVYAFEMDVDAAAAARPRADLRAQSLPRFPAIVRDLSILVDNGLPAATVRGTIRAAAPETLAGITEFDRYRGAGVPEGRVSLSLRLTFRSPDRTLTDAEADAAMAGIVEALASTHGAVRR
jgi:phenylalanyl-tRNA synthetase beta chain